MRWLVLAMLAVASPAAGQDKPLRELVTDRPDKTEAPQTVDAGHVQLEFDFATFNRDTAGGVRSDTMSVLPLNLKYGVSDSTDVQLIVEPHVRRVDKDRVTGTVDRVAGFGDVSLRVKHNLWGNDGGKTALALMPFATLPTNHGDLGPSKVEAGLIVPLTVELSDTIDLAAMTEVDVVERESGRGYTASFINSASLGFSLTKKLGLYTELYTERAAERGSGWIVTGDAGLTYQLTDNLQIDTGINIGLSHAADDVEWFAGLSRRF